MVKLLRQLSLGILLLWLVPAMAQDISVPGSIRYPNFCTVTGATPQTCNGASGAVTTGTLTTAAVTNAAYVINNSAVAATSRISCSLQSYSGTLVTNGIPVPVTCVPGAGTITVNMTNVHATNALNGVIVIGFNVAN